MPKKSKSKSSKKGKSPGKHKVVNFMDVNELLSFAKEEYKELELQIKEEERVEEELLRFIKEVEKHSGHIIDHIGKDKKYGDLLIKFIFKDGGYLEVISEKPLSMNAHFMNEESAEKFADGLKEALKTYLPDHPIKNMVIESVTVGDGDEINKEDELTFDKWTKLHKVAISHTLVVTIVAIIIFFMIELIKEIFKEVLFEYVHLSSMAIALITAVIIALIFDEVKQKVEKIVKKIFGF